MGRAQDSPRAVLSDFRNRITISESLELSFMELQVRCCSTITCEKLAFLILAPLFTASLAGQPVVLEDWTCPTFVAAVTGNPTVFTCSSPHGYPQGTQIYIEGGTGTWSRINVTGQNWPVTIINSTQISIPFDSTGTTFDGQNLAVRRANLDWGSAMISVNLAESWSLTDQPQEGFLRVTVPGCPDLSDDIGCGRGFSSPENAKYPGLHQGIQTFSVAGGVATVSLTAPFPDDPPPGTNRQIGLHSLVWVRNMSNNTLNQSYVVQSITPDHRQITVRAPAGVANGTYTGTTPTLYINWPVAPYVFIRTRTKTGYIYPQATVQNYIKSGVFSPTLNRIRYWIRFGKNINMLATGTTATNLQNGTYWLSSSDNSTNKLTHSYHYANSGNSYAGVWQKVEFNVDFTHVEGANGYFNWGNDASYNGFPYRGWAGTPIHYVDALGTWYIDLADSIQGIDYSGETFDVGPIELDTATGEPEELIASRNIQAVPSRFATGDAGYELNWSGPKSVPVRYEVRYSTANSLKVAGFSTGLCKNGTTVCSTADSVSNLDSAYVGVSYASAPMAQQPNIWFGIRPTIGLLSASGQGQSPIWLVTGVDLSMNAGDHVTVAGVGGNTAANQVNVPIQDTLPRQIWYRFTPQPTSLSAIPGTLTNITATSGTCTVSLNVSHGIVPGWTIAVYGSTNAKLGQDAVVNYRVTSVPTPQSMVFSCPGVPDGKYDANENSTTSFNVSAYPAISIPGTGNANWTSAGTVVSTEENKNFAEISMGATPKAEPFQTGLLSSCDVNGDGVVNIIDVQLEIDAYENLIPCTVDPDHDGTCDLVDVQRVINAALTGVCQVGP